MYIIAGVAPKPIYQNIHELATIVEVEKTAPVPAFLQFSLISADLSKH